MPSPKRKRNLLYTGLAAIHAFWLMLLSFWLLNWSFVHWDEGEIIQFGPILKKLVWNLEEKPDTDEFLFINVSHDYELTDIMDEWGIPIGNEPITDRKKLAEFIRILHQNDNHRAILFDIRFDLSSSNDSSLAHAFQHLDRYVVSTHMSDSTVEDPVIPVKTAVADYPISGGSFFKFKYLIKDTIKTVPIVLDEIINGKKYTKNGAFLFDGNKRYLNVFLIDLLVRPHDLFDAEDHYFYEHLGNLLFLDSDDLSEITKDKIIVLGDFEKYDIHDTLLGEMPGPLILLNAYLTLKNNTNQLSWIFLIFIFLSYFVLSTIIFFPEDPLERIIKKVTGDNKVTEFITSALSYFLLLVLIVLSCYLVFGILLNVLWLVFYLYIIDKLVTFLNNKFL